MNDLDAPKVLVGLAIAAAGLVVVLAEPVARLVSWHNSRRKRKAIWDALTDLAASTIAPDFEITPRT